jgi:transcription elongation factor Elf1
MKASVVLSKCPRSNELYGMRIEERNNDWVRTWAFKISEQKAKHEGYEKAKKTGSMKPSLEYPGCPYCGAMDIAQCSCGKLFCWRSETNAAVCPWCGQKGEYHTVEKIDVEGKGI